MTPIEAIKRMRKVRKLARMYPVETLPKRLDAIAQAVRGEEAATAAPEAPRRQSRAGLDRMERGGESRGSSGDAA